eukprot:3647212-Ditylum_brightwellii.AAC.1
MCTTCSINIICKYIKENEIPHVHSKGSVRKYNVHSDENLTWGTGQGACDSPPKWMFTDNAITKAYNKRAIGCSIWDPTKMIKKKQNQ